jgi:hypothetical protein
VCDRLNRPDQLAPLLGLFAGFSNPAADAVLAIHDHPDAAARTSIFRAVVRLLGISSTEALLELKPTERALLTRPLQDPYQDVDLTLACLEAIGKLGDPRLVPKVRVLAEESKATERMRAVRDASRACLLAYAASKEAVDEQRTLLRGAAIPEPAPESLLRPAAASETEAEAEQLLRPEAQ